jgi:hypothetical protein
MRQLAEQMHRCGAVRLFDAPPDGLMIVELL